MFAPGGPQLVYGLAVRDRVASHMRVPQSLVQLQAGIATGIPVIFGVLTTETVEQALNRSGLKAGNKGVDAALAAIEMVNLLGRIGRPGTEPLP